MLRKFVVLGAAIAAIALSAIPTQPVKAGSCAVVTAEGRGWMRPELPPGQLNT